MSQTSELVRAGLVQVYTGNGKGKTTAALGLAVRAVGAGMRVFFCQFTKGQRCSEHEAMTLLGERITIRQFGDKAFIIGPPKRADRQAAADGLAQAAQAMRGGEYGLVILDEICVAAHLGLVAELEVLAAIQGRAAGVEVVLTGRDAPLSFIQAADLVTEMREIKHYYAQGVKSRRGIEW